MKKLFLKTLLTALVLSTGGVSPAWAQISTWTASNETYTKGQEIKGSVEGVITMTLGEDDNWSFSSSRNAIYANTQQSPTLTDGLPTAGGYVKITPNKTLNLSLTTYSSQSNCNLYMIEESAPNSFIKNFRQKAYATNDFGVLESGKTYYIYGSAFKSTGALEYIFYQKFTATTIENYTIKYVDDQGNAIADDKVLTGLYGSSVSASDEDLTSIVYNNMSYAYVSGNNPITLSGNADDNVITLVYQAASVANYIVKYVLESDPTIEIKDAETIESYVGASVVAAEAIVPSYISFNEVKYKYISGNNALNVTGNEETDVITLLYAPAPVYDYAVKAYDASENELATIAEGNYVEGDAAIVVPYSQYFLSGNTLFNIDNNKSGDHYRTSFTPNAVAYQVKLTYDYGTVDNVVYYTEGEDINGVSQGANTARASKGGMGHTGGEENYQMVTTLSPGKYKIYARGVNGNSAARKANFKVNNEVVFAFDIPNGVNVLGNSDEFSVALESILYFSSTGSNASGVDWIYIQKTGDVSEEEIAAAQLAAARQQLQEAIEASNAVNLDGLSEEEISQFTTAINTYEALLTDETATAETIQTKATELAALAVSKDMHAQTARETAKSELSTLIDEAEAIETEGMNGADALAAAITEAENVLNSTESKYQDYIDAKSALADAIDAFNAANEPAFDPATAIVNASFEEDGAITTSNKALTITGWTQSDPGNSYNNTGCYDASTNIPTQGTVAVTPSDGNYFLFFRHGWNGNGAPYTFTSNQATLPAGKYTLSADYKMVEGYDDSQKNTSSVTIMAKDGETVLGSAEGNVKTNVAGGGDYTYLNTADWSTVTATFALEEETSVNVVLSLYAGGQRRTDFCIDNVQLTYKTFEEAAAEELAAAKEALLNEIKQATSFETETRPEGTADYDEAITQAQAVYNSSDATVTDLENAKETLHSAEIAYLTANLPVAEGTYYIFNPLTKMFFGRGNAWGTSAVVGNYGVAINVTAEVSTEIPDGKYSLTSFDNNTYYGDDAWMYADAGGDRVRTYILDKVGNGVTMTNTNNNQLVYVYLKEDGNKYRVAGNAIKDDNYTDDAQTVWQFITPEAYNKMIADRIAAEKTAAFTAAKIAEDAEVVVGEPVELTFATGHSWTQTVVRTQDNQPATNGNGTEMWQATGNYTQTVSDLPSGLYKVSIQAFYRNGGADECVTRYNTGYNTVLAYLEANGSKAQVKSWAEDKGEGNDPNSMGQAKAKFDDGKYVSETYAYVGEDSLLNLTVYNPAFIGNGWFIVGNVKYAKVDNKILAGDANLSGDVTVGDAVLTVSFALEREKPTEDQKKAADINNSNTITIADAVGIVNIALSVEPEEPAAARGSETVVNYLTQDGTEIGLVNTTEFAGFQMDVTLCDGAMLSGVKLADRARNLTLTYSQLSADTWRIVALSLDGSVISGNDGSLISLDIMGQGGASVSHIEFADRAASAYELGFITPTGISTLYNNKVEGEVYTVSGTRTGSMKKGVNVVRQADGKVSKVLVK